MHPRLLPLPAVAALGLIGCGDRSIDAGRAQQSIGATVSRQAGVRVQRVQCPAGQKAHKDGRFTCTVTGIDGTTGPVTVVQRDDDGNVRFAAPFLHVREAERVMARQLRATLHAATVTVRCPEIVIVAAGRRFVCRARAGGRTLTVRARQTDTRGHFTYRAGSR
jgi:uncharacterized protein DUF4333